MTAWPDGYPSRGTWRFRNVTRGADFLPTLESVSVIQDHPEGLATLSAIIVDEDATQTFAEEDRIWATFTPYGGTIRRIFGGHIKVCVEQLLSEVGPREYEIQAQDYTAKLDDSVIDHEADRASESNADRVSWILGFLNFSITTTNVSPPSGTSERANFHGMTVREALDQFCEENDAHYYLDFGPEDPDDGNTPDLHLFGTETISAPFDLDDTAADFATSFPAHDVKRAKDSGDLATALYVIGENGEATWVTDAGAIATYGRQERTLNDDTLKTSTARTKAGNQQLARDGAPSVDGSFVCWEPGLRAGMRPNLTIDLWGFDAPVWLTSVTITAVDPHDDADEVAPDGVALLKSECSFTQRRRFRGGGRKRPPRKDTNADAGTSVGSGSFAVVDRESCWDSLKRDAWTGLFTAGSPFVGSWISQNTAYSVSGCALGGGLWGPGGQTWECWFTVTASGTTGDSGADVTLGNLGTLLGRGDPGPYLVGWANAAPGGLGEFAIVGQIEATGGSVFVPSWLIADGGTNYLVVAPAWEAFDGWSTCAENIVDGFGGPIVGGEGNSGRGIAMGTGDITIVARAVSGTGRAPWHFPDGAGAIDGSNREFTLTGWNGEGVPEARWGVAILAPGYDFEYDVGDQTVTFRDAPPEGTAVGFRFRMD